MTYYLLLDGIDFDCKKFGNEFSDGNWLNSVRYTLSVKTGTLVFAHQTKIIVLSLKWDLRSNQSKYSITWSDELPPYDDITAVLCLPITTEADEVIKFSLK